MCFRLRQDFHRRPVLRDYGGQAGKTGLHGALAFTLKLFPFQSQPSHQIAGTHPPRKRDEPTDPVSVEFVKVTRYQPKAYY